MGVASYALRRGGWGGRGGGVAGGALRSAITDHSFPSVSSSPVIQVKGSSVVCGPVPAHPGSGTHTAQSPFV